MTEQDTVQDFDRLVELRDRGLISPDEYEAKRQELLAQIGQLPAAPLAVAGHAAQPPAAADAQVQRINNAFILELVGGVFGLLGIGYMYVDRTNDGVLRLVGWWLLLGVMWTTIALLSAILIGLCFIPGAIVVQFGVPIYSAMQLKKQLLVEAGLPSQ
jgi:hypothetical protein